MTTEQIVACTIIGISILLFFIIPYHGDGREEEEA